MPMASKSQSKHVQFQLEPWSKTEGNKRNQMQGLEIIFSFTFEYQIHGQNQSKDQERISSTIESDSLEESRHIGQSI